MADIIFRNGLFQGMKGKVMPDGSAALVVAVGDEPTSAYLSGNGNHIETSTTLGDMFSDDFGGSAVRADLWDVLNGGLAGIGSGITGMTDSVAASALTVAMGTTASAERWYLSKETFSGKEDILVVCSKSQPLAANSIFIGLVEVDPTTLQPILNPNFAGDFTNRGGVELGLLTTSTAFTAEAVADSSPAKASSAVGVAGAALTTTQEYLIEIDSRDITVSSSAVDSTAAKAAGAVRVSSQCPNDSKLYKLVMRFRNVSAPATNTNFVIQRVLVVNNYEQRVQISTAEGDTVASKAMPVNVIGTVPISGSIVSATSSTTNGVTQHKLIAAASVNATLLKASAGRIVSGFAHNISASIKFLKFYNKASAPTVGTDAPVMTIPILPNEKVQLADIVGNYGLYCSAGLGYGLTGAVADADTTALAAGDVVLAIGYA